MSFRIPLKFADRLIVDPGADFRGKATLGVALTSLVLLAPFGVVSLLSGKFALAIGTFGIVTILVANAVSVIQRHDHQNLTLYGLVPAVAVFTMQLFLNHGVVGGLWCHPSILACYGMLDERKAHLANAMIVCVAIPMAFLTLEVGLAARVCATMLSVSVFAIVVVRVIEQQQAQLLRQIRLDPLTGLLNRTSLHATLERTIVSAEHRPAALLAIDVDFFKRVNDSFGHEVGDYVLCGIADILRAQSPDSAFVFRLGGEEFLVLLPASDPAEALLVAEHLRLSVMRTPLTVDHPVTVSIGVAPLAEGDDWMSWMRLGDQRLFTAKREGRNRVVAGCETDDRIDDRADANLGRPLPRSSSAIG